MNILITTGIFPPDAGGPATYVPRIGRELVSRGHNVRVLTLADHPASDTPDYPFSVVRVGRRHLLPIRLLLTIVAIVRWGRHVDVLYVNGLFLETALANLVLRRPAVQKIVGDWAWESTTNSRRSTDDFLQFQRSRGSRFVEAFKGLRAMLARTADRTIVPSAFLGDVVHAWGVARDQIRVVHNSPPLPPQVPPLEPPDTVRRIVTVGRLIAPKRVDEIIRAVASLGPGTELVIVGDGPEEANLRALAADLGIADRIRFLGRLPQHEVLSVIARSHVFVLNSTYEGLPHVLLEAMYVGVPAVARAVGGVPEVLGDGRTGLLIQSNDLDQLRGAIRRLLDDPALYRRLSEAGRAEVRERFSLEAMVSATERELAAAAGREPASDDPARGGGRSFLTQSFALTLTSAGGTVFNVVQGAIVARVLGPADFGVTALVLAYPALVSGVFDARISDFGMKYLGQFSGNEHRDRARGISLLGVLLDAGVAVLTLVVVFVTGGWANAHVLGTPGGAELMTLYTASLILRAPVGTAYVTLVLRGEMKRLLWAEIGSSFLRSVTIVALTIAGFGVPGVIWGNIAGVALQGTAYAVAAVPVARRTWGLPRLSSLRHLEGMWGELWRFVGYSELHALLLTVPRQLDLIIVGAIAGPVQAGYFRLGRTFQTGVWLVGGPLQQSAFRQISLLRGREQNAGTRRFTRRIAATLAVGLTVPVLILVLIAPWLVRIVAGDAFLGGTAAVRILFVAAGLWAIGAWIRPWFLAAGQIGRYTMMVGLAIVPYAIVGLLTTPTLGAAGMALGYLVYTLVLLVPLAVVALK
jgi:glycosyltransferase involved in cell wall biosynthesis/O-antigen/teichoic acid export membrane protein